MKELKAHAARDIAELRHFHATETDNIKNSHAEIVANLKNSHAEELEALKFESEECHKKLQAQDTEIQYAVYQQTKHFQKELNCVRLRASEEITSVEQSAKKEAQQIRDRHMRKLAVGRREWESERKILEGEFKDAKETFAQQIAELKKARVVDSEIAAATDKYASMDPGWDRLRSSPQHIIPNNRGTNLRTRISILQNSINSKVNV